MNKKYFYIIIGLLALLGAYFIIQQLGLLKILSALNEDNISYGLIFIIGILASFHCVAMCGSLVITYTAKDLAENKKPTIVPHFQYNLGRLISYTVVGALLGGIGSFFAINQYFISAITIFAGILMLLMGVSLVKKISWLEKIKPRTPLFIARFMYAQKIKAPLLIGLFNGLMPCGPLQAMQLYALGTGSFIKGGLAMFIYALGTIPLMFGFGSMISKIGLQKLHNFVKFSGIIVIILAGFMLYRGITNFNSFTPAKITTNEITADADEQIVRMDLTAQGYEPNTLTAVKGKKVKWIINVKQLSGCTSTIQMPDYNISKKLSKGENIIEFTPNKTGEIDFSCGMQMVWGKFIIK